MRPRFGLIRGCLSANPRGLEAGLELVAHLALHPRRQDRIHFGQEPLDRRTIALGYYAAFGLAALVASLLNPKGLEIILTSALASSLGAIAGLITIGFGARGAGEGRRFIIARNTALLVLGPAATVLFALALGPTIRF